MQTFIIDQDLSKNFTFLDSKRLFKQLLEATQILGVLANGGKGWANHPAVKQWKGYEIALFFYIKANWKECQNRGIAPDSQLFYKAESLIVKFIDTKVLGGTGSWGEFFNFEKNKPDWWGREDILSSHRSRLRCKGLIDVLCDGIKNHFKIKSIDKWCKEQFKLTKNQLKFEHIEKLNKICAENAIVIKLSFYEKFNWTDDPSKDYIWLV